MLSLFGGTDVSEAEEDGENEEDITDDFLAAISQSLFSSEETGPPISEKLAKIVNKNFESEFDIDKLKTNIKSYKRPQNFDQLYVPEVNSETWSNILARARKTDTKVANLQYSLLRGISAVIVTLNEILQCEANKGKINRQNFPTKLINATALMGHVAKELPFNRKEALWTFLHGDLRQACF